jgi:threonyl-tRNA synthetase
MTTPVVWSVQDNMFHFEVEKQVFGLKPMNCPGVYRRLLQLVAAVVTPCYHVQLCWDCTAPAGHCIMYKHTKRSYRDLPMRFADFGVLHRNEYRWGGLVEYSCSNKSMQQRFYTGFQ